MNKRKIKEVPLSLAQHFTCPEDFVGSFGWMCGFSADSIFMEDAAERFTLQNQSQRAFGGSVSIALMLDPSNPQMTPKEVPGLLHVPMLPNSRPFRLLHAKTAILGFRHETDASQWYLRLIVSTGNWTMDTLGHSLDLVWSVDLSSADVKAKAESLAQTSADLNAAWDLMTWLRGFFDDRALDAKRVDRKESSSRSAANLLERWIKSAKRHRKSTTPQFFDNRKQSLLDALPSQVITHTSDGARNYLAMGSGFYETPNESGDVPVVLANITTTLRQHGLLTRDPEVDVFVNPKSCQAVAGSVNAIQNAGWTVRDAWDPLASETPRSLHAKFLFSYHCRANSARCNSGWLYLGSGNLTSAGFARKMSTHGGNMEAGVVIDAASLRWNDENHVIEPPVLPIQQTQEFMGVDQELGAGADTPESEQQFVAPPISYLVWRSHKPGGWLISRESSTVEFLVLDESESACHHDEQHGFRWLGVMPRETYVEWPEASGVHRASIPVMDQLGRLAAPLASIGVRERRTAS